MDSNIQNQLEQTLQSDGRVWVNNDSNETSILAKNILLDLVEKTDPTIIGLLLSNDDLKRHFFVEVNGVLVFKLPDFLTQKHSQNSLAIPQTANKRLAKSNVIQTAHPPKISLSKAII